MFEQEVWEDIPNYENYYKISNYGRIKSIPRNGTQKEEKILKPTINKEGYYRVPLSKNGKIKMESVHRLVGKTFIENPYNKPTINHIDGNKTNNYIGNLEWATRKEQIDHAYSQNLIKHHKKKVIQYDFSGKYITTWESIKEAEKELKISVGSISKVCHKKRKAAGGFIWRFFDNN